MKILKNAALCIMFLAVSIVATGCGVIPKAPPMNVMDCFSNSTAEKKAEGGIIRSTSVCKAKANPAYTSWEKQHGNKWSNGKKAGVGVGIGAGVLAVGAAILAVVLSGGGKTHITQNNCVGDCRPR